MLAEFYLRSNQQHYIQTSEVAELKKKLEESKATRAYAETAWKVAENAQAATIQARDGAIAVRDDAAILTNSL